MALKRLASDGVSELPHVSGLMELNLARMNLICGCAQLLITLAMSS